MPGLKSRPIRLRRTLPQRAGLRDCSAEPSEVLSPHARVERPFADTTRLAPGRWRRSCVRWRLRDGPSATGWRSVALASFSVLHPSGSDLAGSGILKAGRACTSARCPRREMERRGFEAPQEIYVHPGAGGNLYLLHDRLFRGCFLPAHIVALVPIPPAPCAARLGPPESGKDSDRTPTNGTQARGTASLYASSLRTLGPALDASASKPPRDRGGSRLVCDGIT